MTSRSAPILPPLAAHGARLEAAGAGPTEIARQTGVDERTVKRWRARPDYRALRDRLSAEANVRVLDRATSVRLKALRLVERSVEAGHALLDAVEAQDEDTPAAERVVIGTLGLAQLAKTGLDAYRVTAAQTGIAETTRTEVEVSAPEEVRKLLRQDLDALTDDELDALRARRAT